MPNPARTIYLDPWGGHPPDDGCNVAPSCLRCPLERCKYDYGSPAAMNRARRRTAMVELVRSGHTQGEAAELAGVSIRTVRRAIQAEP